MAEQLPAWLAEQAAIAQTRLATLEEVYGTAPPTDSLDTGGEVETDRPPDTVVVRVNFGKHDTEQGEQ